MDEHFLRFGQLVPLDQEVMTLPIDAPARDALALMQQEGFDQLPVTRDSVVVGVFSYRSFAQGIGVVRAQDDPLGYPVSEFLEDLRFVRRTSEVAEAISALNDSGAVLVGDEDNLLAVVTSTDLSTFLWNLSEQFIALRDIELAVRHLVRSACPDDGQLQRYLAAVSATGTPAASLDELTYGELVSLINHRERFGRVFARTFGLSREIAFSTLDPVREVRNKVFHFRGEVTAADMDAVVTARLWLRRKVRMVG
ncbi:CBS domain-containing protein [Asanoa sp. NPDC050611]|uniref:CBS domain-containing protein n=1 Tax=Asanoa sp. NPDC050611 TaxID=3157098 RepID=UPI003400D427